jgi:hypothetical protein
VTEPASSIRPAPSVPYPSPFTGLAGQLRAGLSRGPARVAGTAVGPYQTAVVRIGFSLTWLLFLLREWPHRQELYGPDGVWSWEMAHALIADNHAFTVLMWTRGQLWFEIVYAGAILASALLLVGWRTRTSSLLFMIGVLSLQNRSVFEGDGGDNVVHLMAIYLVLTRCGEVWSLDARRRRRGRRNGGAADVVLWAAGGAALFTVSALGLLSSGWAVIFWGFWLAQTLWWVMCRYAPGEPRTVLDILANLAHNGALLVIVVEVCLIYATAGWYKIQGSRWQDGTALYYPLHLDDFSPWPGLSHALAGNGLMVMLISYGTVIVQVAFPFTLFNRRVKNVLLALMMLEHASIAVVLGLPFFSLAMIAADAVFLPTGFLRWAGDRLSGLVRRRRPAAGEPPEAGPSPADQPASESSPNLVAQRPAPWSD